LYAVQAAGERRPAKLPNEMPEEDQRTRSMWTAVAALAGAATLEVSAASPRIAERRGVERNTYYKQADYCVRSQQAIRYFGNTGCYIHGEARIRFALHIRRRIDELLRLERVPGCPR
jgi:hypothetical protein